MEDKPKNYEHKTTCVTVKEYGYKEDMNYPIRI
jgi:hypothetical protein